MLEDVAGNVLQVGRSGADRWPQLPAMALSQLNSGGESAMQVEIKIIGVFEADR